MYLLALVETLDMELEQLDVKITFHHGGLEEEILMQQPEGFDLQGKEIFSVGWKGLCIGQSNLQGIGKRDLMSSLFLMGTTKVLMIHVSIIAR